MDDHAVLVEKLRRYFEHSGTDPDFAHEIYHDDAVLEFPQSGERFEGVANFKEWRARYPADVQYRRNGINSRSSTSRIRMRSSGMRT